ncbi:MAG: hypothetical protein K1W24_00625 [Lachnospiraceae bacterium]
MQGNVKGTVKDSIFCNLFKIKKYLLQLYQALHPEDLSMTEEGLKNVTINHVFTNGIYNDLCFMAGGRLVLMLEAQSTWSVNVIISKQGLSIMMALFDQEEVFNTYVKSEVREAVRKAEKKTTKETAIKMAINLLKTGKCSIDEIREIAPQLDEEDIIEIEKELYL